MDFGCCCGIDSCESVRRAGFDFIELPGNVLARISEEELGCWLGILEATRVPCRGLNAAIAPEVSICGEGFDAAAARDYLRRLCERARRVGAKVIGIGSPKSRKYTHGFGLKRAWEQAETFLRIAVECAAPQGITILWEPLNAEETEFGIDALESAEHIARLRREGVENIGLVGDFYHMLRRGDSPEAMQAMLPLLGHLHLASARDGARGYVSESDRQDVCALLKVCVESGVQTLSAETFSGDIEKDGGRMLHLLAAWLSGDE